MEGNQGRKEHKIGGTPQIRPPRGTRGTFTTTSAATTTRKMRKNCRNPLPPHVSSAITHPSHQSPIIRSHSTNQTTQAISIAALSATPHRRYSPPTPKSASAPESATTAETPIVGWTFSPSGRDCRWIVPFAVIADNPSRNRPTHRSHLSPIIPRHFAKSRPPRGCTARLSAMAFIADNPSLHDNDRRLHRRYRRYSKPTPKPRKIPQNWSPLLYTEISRCLFLLTLEKGGYFRASPKNADAPFWNYFPLTNGLQAQAGIPVAKCAVSHVRQQSDNALIPNGAFWTGQRRKGNQTYNRSNKNTHETDQ